MNFINKIKYLLLTLACFSNAPSFNAQNKTLDSLLVLLKNTNNDSIKANLLIDCGRLAQEKSLAMNYWRQACDAAKRSKVKWSLCRVYSILADGYQNASVDSCYYYCMKSLALGKEINNSFRIGLVYDLLSSCFHMNGEHKKESFYRDSAFVFLRKPVISNAFDEKIRQTKLINVLAVGARTMLEEHHIREAKATIKEAITLANNLNLFGPNKFNFTLIYAELFREDSNLDSAKYYYNSLIEMSRASGDKGWESYSYAMLAQCYSVFKKHQEAKEYGIKGLEFAKEHNLVKEIGDNLSVLIKLFSASGDFKSALKYTNESVRFNDSLRSLNGGELQNKFEGAVKNENIQLQLDLVKKEKDIEKLKTEQQKFYTFLSIGGVVLLLFFAVFITSRFRVIRRQKEIIEIQKHLVDVKQKEILDSITYAKRIQQSLLPTEKYIEKRLEKLKNDKET